VININDNNTSTVESEVAEATEEQPLEEVDSGNENSEEQSEESETQEQSTETEGEGEGESFFDPNSVPDELKPAYKQMQAAFTKKTQEIAQAKKEAEALKQQAGKYQEYERYAPIIEEMLSGNKQVSTTPELAALEQDLRSKGYSDEAIDMMKVGVGFTLNHFNQTKAQEVQEAQQRAEITRIDSGITEASKLDSRLTDSSLVYEVGDGEKATFGQIVEQLVAADPSWQKDPKTATLRAIKKVDALVSNAKTEGKKELSASASVKARKFPKVNSSPQGSGNTDREMTVQEAYKEAKSELGL
jgi:hypothetical protein